MIKLYGRKTAFNVQKVLWFLHELNLDFELIELGGDFGGLDTQEFSKININKTIPVLEDHKVFIWESHTILRYLAAKYTNEWYSINIVERSNYERWMDWSQTKFQPIFMNLFWGFYRQPKKNHNYDIINENLLLISSCINILGQQLNNNTYLLGEKITLADITIGSVLYRLLNMGLDIKIPNNINKWYQNIKKRDGYEKWIMSDFSTLKGKTSF